MRGTIAFVVLLLVACGSDGPKKRVPGGKSTSVAGLIKMLDALREADAQAAPLLAEGVAEVCGKACECIAPSDEAGDRARTLAACRDLWKEQATPNAGHDWLAVSVAGAYLADQYDAANAREKRSLEEAMAALTIPIAPTAAALGVAPPPARQLDTLDGAHILTIDAKGDLRGGTGPTARLTPTGAVLAPAELKPLADATVLEVFLRALSDDPLGTAPLTGAGKPGDRIGTGVIGGVRGAPDPDAAAARRAPDPAAGPPDDDSPTVPFDPDRPVDPDYARARQEAIEQARKSGILGSLALEGSRTGGMYAIGPEYGGLIGGAKHSATGTSRMAPRGALVIVADRGAPGPRLVEVLSLAQVAVIAVEQGDALAAVPLVFRGPPRGDADGGGAFAAVLDPSVGDDLGYNGGVGWADTELVIEVNVDHVLVGHSKVRDITRVDADAAAVEKAVAAAMKDAIFDDRRDVVVSVRDAARVAQVAAALDGALAAGARTVRIETWYDRRATFGVPDAGDPDDPGAARTPAVVPNVSIGQPSAVGDLDKAVIRRYIRRALPKITYCYEKVLLAKEGLQGTVTAQFFITPNGTVATSTASGLDPDVASCVAAVIKTIEFPEPKGGGGVQVNYPFTFRPAP